MEPPCTPLVLVYTKTPRAHTIIFRGGSAASAVLGRLGRLGAMSAASARQPPKLVLHFDVNETIMCGDPAGGDTFEASLNKIICKSALVQTRGIARGGMPTRWRDGSAIASSGTEPPPLFTGFEWPEGTVSFYRAGPSAKACARTFTEPGQPGEAYRPLFNRLEESLRWPQSIKPPKRLCHDGMHHFLIPAFFTTIRELAKRGAASGIVIRTFGTDADDVVAALQAYTEGLHLSAFNNPIVSEMSGASLSCWKGRYTKEGTFSLTRSAGQEEQDAIVDEDEIVRIFCTVNQTKFPVLCAQTTITGGKTMGTLHGREACVAGLHRAAAVFFFPFFLMTTFTMTPKIPSLL